MEHRSTDPFQLEPLEPRLLLSADPLTEALPSSVSEPNTTPTIVETPKIGKQGVGDTGEIRGAVWFDTNQDGIFDMGEPGIGGWEVFLDSNGNGALDVTETPAVFASTDVDKPFGTPQPNFINSTVLVSGITGNLADLNLRLNVTHPNLPDMNVNLTAPDGTTMAFDLLGYSLSGANLVDTVLDDEASGALDTGTAPYTGSFLPGEALSAFDGVDPNGVWTLNVYTFGAPGILDGWSLEFTTATPNEPVAVTAADGTYAFTNLPAGMYSVGQVLRNGWTDRAPPGGFHAVTLNAGQVVTDIDFGVDAPTASAQGSLFHDLNGDGFLHYPVEPPLSGWTAYADLNGNGQADAGEPSAMSDEFGFYTIQGIPPGTWVFRAQLPEPAANESHWRATNAGATATLAPGAGEYLEDLSAQKLAAISGVKWEDLNGDGVKDGGEPGLSGWTIYLDANQNGQQDEGEASASTDNDGKYQFLDLEPGVHRVVEESRLGWKQTFPSGPAWHETSLEAGGGAQDLNFGNQRAEITGTVFHDLNRNGALDDGEPGVSGRMIDLDLDGDGSVDDTATTNDAGQFAFIGVAPGTHSLSLRPLTDWVQTLPAGDAAQQVEVVMGMETSPIQFGAFLKPDLVVTDLPATPAGFGETVTVNYTSGLNGMGVLAAADQWIEEVWITDDGKADGAGFEILMASTMLSAVGAHAQMVTLPSFGETASTDGTGIVTAAMAEAGLQVVVRLDPAAAVLERDRTNNAAAVHADWKLADLVVDSVELRPFLAFNVATLQIRAQGELKYTVRNAGEVAIPEGVVWREQVWLANNANVGAGIDAKTGQFHLLIAPDTAISGTSGPLAPGASMTRTVTIDLPVTKLPKNFDPETLGWLIFLDVPADMGGAPLPPPDDANIGAVYEKHEASPAGTNNIFNQRAFDPLIRVTEKADGTQFNGGSQLQGMSADGRWLLISSGAGDVIPDDPGGGLFLHDRDVSGDGFFDEPGDTRFIRVPGSPSGLGIVSASLSSNGRYVAFEEVTIAAGGNLFQSITDVYLHDRDADGNGVFDEAGGTSQTLVSVNAAGSPARRLNPSDGLLSDQGGGSANPLVADNGAVFFESDANNLVVGANPAYEDPFDDARFPFAGDNTNSVNVFVHHNGYTDVVDLRPDGRPAYSGTFHLDSITPDGSKVVFTAFDTTLVPGLPQGFYSQRVFVRDMGSRAIALVSQSSDGSPSNGHAGRISADGTKVVFWTNSTTPVGSAEDTNGQADVFLRDLVKGTTVRVNLTSTIVDMNGAVTGGEQAINDAGDSSTGSFTEAISPDGRFVVFTSFSDNLRTAEELFADGLIYDTVARKLTSYTLTPEGAPTYRGSFGSDNGDLFSADNRFVAFTTFSDIFQVKNPHVIFDNTPDVFVRHHHPLPIGEIKGSVVSDPDKSGDVQPADEPVSGIKVYLDENDNAAWDAGEEFSLTDSQGRFKISVVAEADRPYRVRILTLDPLQQTFPADAASDPAKNGFFRVTFDPASEGYETLRLNGSQDVADKRIRFAVFTKPDLVVDKLTQPAAPFATTNGMTATYTTIQRQQGGGILPTDQWTEEIWLTDDGTVDGMGFELKLDSRAYTAVGDRSVTFDSPAIGTDPGQVPADKVRAGLQLVARVDTTTAPAMPKTRVVETDTANNAAAIDANWALPDLAVSDITRAPLAFDSVLEELTYKVKNVGDAPVSGSWFEQLWLGTDENITAADNPAGGVWHVRVPIGATDPSNAPKAYTAGTNGPMAPDSEATRTLIPNLTGIQLPEGVDPTQLNWIVLLDWPADANAAGADPGAVVEKHEVPAPSPGQKPANAFLYPAAEIDLSPLQLVVVNGSFSFNGSIAKFEANGMIQVGFKPGEGEQFSPLLTVEGSVKFDKLVIEMNGKVTVNVFNLQVPLFDGTFKFDVGQAASSFLQETVGSLPTKYKVAGTEIQLTRLALVNPGGGSLADAQLEIEGKLKFPESLGGVELAVTDPNKIVISAAGVSITGAALKFPDVEFNFLNLLKVKATDLSVTYTSDPKSALKIQGKVNLPDIYNAVADFAGDNYIQVSEGGVEVVGTLSMENIVIVANTWEIKTATVTIDTTKNKVEGMATLLVPTGIEVTAGLGFIDGDLNFISLGAADLNKPIGSTGAFLQSISGKVNNIAPAAKAPLTFSGGVGLTAGPTITINAPSWAGGPYSGSAVELNVNGSIDANHLEANGELKIVGGIVTGTAGAELNWNEGYLKANGSLSALGGVITFSGAFRADFNLNLTLSATAAVNLPGSIPIIGGTELGSGSMYLQYRNNGSSADDFVAGWGSLTIPLYGKVTKGIRVRFDGSWETLGATEIAAIAGPQSFINVGSVEGIGLQTVVPGAMQAFDVPSGTPYALFGADWDNPGSGVEIQLLAPDETLYDEAAIAADPNMELAAGLSDMSGRTVVVVNPTPGTWTVIVPDVTGLGNVSFSAQTEASGAPTVSLTGPAADAVVAVGDMVAIDYTAADPDDAMVDIAFYLDTDREGFDGQLIGHDMIAPAGAATYSWDTAGFAAGDYFVYAVVQDGDNVPAFSRYSLGRVRVVDPQAPGQVRNLAAAFVASGAVRVSWDAVAGADFYRIRYTPNAAGLALPEIFVTDGAVNSAEISGLIAGETYRFEVQAIKNPDHVGLPGRVVGVAGPRPTVPPAGEEWPVFADPGSAYTRTVSKTAGDTLTLRTAPAGATLNTDTGLFEWTVPTDRKGAAEIVIDVAHDDGSVDQIRRILFSDALRFAGVSGLVFQDADGDGIAEFGEAGTDGVTVELWDGSGQAKLLDTVTGSGGRFAFDDVTPGDYSLRVTLEPGQEALPAADRGLALVGGDATVVDFGLRAQPAGLSGEVFNDLDGNGVRGPQEPGLPGVTVFLDLNGNGLRDGAALQFAGSGAAIPDQGTVEAPIAIAGALGTVGSLRVTLDINHAFSGDLDVALVSPSGTVVELFSDFGASAAGFVDTTFSDTATVSLTGGSGSYTGAFQPAFPLAAFHGEDAAGVWRLRVTDDALSDTGALNGWSLDLQVAEPAATADADDPMTTETDETGRYAFASLPAGSYRVAVAPQAGFRTTAPDPATSGAAHTVSLAAGDSAGALDFGLIALSDGVRPTVLSSGVNQGGVQRSRVTGLIVDFDEDVSLGLDAADFALVNLTAGRAIPAEHLGLAFDAHTGRATLTFVGEAEQRLADGEYRLTVLANGFTDLGGNHPAADHVFDFHVLSGDADGDRATNDFDLYRVWRNQLKPAEQRDLNDDLNGDGQVDNADVAVVRSNYLHRINPVAPMNANPTPGITIGLFDVRLQNSGPAEIELFASGNSQDNLDWFAADNDDLDEESILQLR